MKLGGNLPRGKHPLNQSVLSPSLFLSPPLDFRPNIHKYITKHLGWNTRQQTSWNCTHCRRTVHFSLEQSSGIICEQYMNNRCRTGHSRLTHRFLLKGEPPPECIPCPLTIKHLLNKCADFNDVTQRFDQVPSLQDPFRTVKPVVILDFLKAAALYRLLWVFEHFWLFLNDWLFFMPVFECLKH